MSLHWARPAEEVTSHMHPFWLGVLLLVIPEQAACFSLQEAWEQFSQEARGRSKVISDLEEKSLICGSLFFFLITLGSVVEISNIQSKFVLSFIYLCVWYFSSLNYWHFETLKEVFFFS